MRKAVLPRLVVDRFAQIAHASIELGDLTVLVGPQATGKSLILQLLKLCLDGQRMKRVLAEFGYLPRDASSLAEMIFGEGLDGVWTRRTRTTFGGRGFDLHKLFAARHVGTPQQLFYVPAQRALSIADGWPAGFRSGPAGSPFVVRWFSEQLRQELETSESRLFPRVRKLKASVRRAIDDAIFHESPVGLEPVRGGTELRLAVRGLGNGRKTHGVSLLPAIAWTAGQREFVPLLVSLYPLLPSSKKSRDPHVRWIVLEEPEMGLHPQGILAVMLMVIELLSRGYRVVMSTHHPLVLDVIWALRRIQENRTHKSVTRVLQVFGLHDSAELRGVASTSGLKFVSA